MNLLIVGSSTPDSEFAVSTSPARVQTSTSNGSYTTPYIEATPFNEVGEVSYLWEILDSNPLISIVGDETSNRIRVRLSGVNDVVFVTIKCVATDDFGVAAGETAITVQFGKYIN